MTGIQILDELLPGVYLLDLPHFPDNRGSFTKVYHHDAFQSLNLSFEPRETFLTKSCAGVLRGMHFQIDEAAHDKLVICLRGRVLDVVVDIRKSSPNFNKPVSIELDESKNTALLVGKGYAHGFLCLEDESWMLYNTSTIHNPELDRGVLWSSLNYNWPIDSPRLSLRDSKHPLITDLL